MKREYIEKAAEDFVMQNSPSYTECFLKGAEWRISSVWHDASEEPQLNKFFVFENECNEWGIDCLYQQTKWKLYVAANDLVRWAYIEDLLPNEEE